VLAISHSMGGQITLLAASMRPTVPAGVVTSGALVKLSDKITGCTRFLARMLAKVSATMGIEAVDVTKLVHDDEWGAPPCRPAFARLLRRCGWLLLRHCPCVLSPHGVAAQWPRTGATRL
jgi:pimeloyl-ACP methyl ester carboxylesterase